MRCAASWGHARDRGLEDDAGIENALRVEGSSLTVRVALERGSRSVEVDAHRCLRDPRIDGGAGLLRCARRIPRPAMVPAGGGSPRARSPRPGGESTSVISHRSPGASERGLGELTPAGTRGGIAGGTRRRRVKSADAIRRRPTIRPAWNPGWSAAADGGPVTTQRPDD
jgi:hypothetical protein